MLEGCVGDRVLKRILLTPDPFLRFHDAMDVEDDLEEGADQEEEEVEDEEEEGRSKPKP